MLSPYSIDVHDGLPDTGPYRRIIPCLDVTEGRVVKGIEFVNLRAAGDPVELAAFSNAEGADELVFLDITASSDSRRTMVDVVERTADQIFIPLTVGGGVRSVADIQRPALIAEGADVFGSQCVVVAIDARRNPGGNGWGVYTHGGRRPVELD